MWRSPSWKATLRWSDLGGEHWRFQASQPALAWGPTKTLAKLANWAAKRLPELDSVFDFTSTCVENEAMGPTLQGRCGE